MEKVIKQFMKSEKGKMIFTSILIFFASFSSVFAARLLFPDFEVNVLPVLFISLFVSLSVFLAWKNIFTLVFILLLSVGVLSFMYVVDIGGIHVSLSRIIATSLPFVLVSIIYSILISIAAEEENGRLEKLAFTRQEGKKEGEIIPLSSQAHATEKQEKKISSTEETARSLSKSVEVIDEERVKSGNSLNRQDLDSLRSATDTEKSGFVRSNVNYLESEVNEDVNKQLKVLGDKIRQTNAELRDKEKELEKIMLFITSFLLVGLKRVRDKLVIVRDFYDEFEKELSEFSGKIIHAMDKLSTGNIPTIFSVEGSPIVAISEIEAKKLEENLRTFGEKLNDVVEQIEKFNVSDLRNNLNMIQENIMYFKVSLLEFSRIPYNAYAISFKIAQMASTAQTSETRRTLFAIEQDIENFSFKSVVYLQKIMENLQKFEEEIMKFNSSFKEKSEKIGTARIMLRYVKMRYDSIIRRRGESFIFETKSLMNSYQADEVNSLVNNLNGEVREAYKNISTLEKDTRDIFESINIARQKINSLISFIDEKISEAEKIKDELSELMRELSSKKLEQTISIHDMKSPRTMKVLVGLFKDMEERRLI